MTGADENERHLVERVTALEGRCERLEAENRELRMRARRHTARLIGHGDAIRLIGLGAARVSTPGEGSVLTREDDDDRLLTGVSGALSGRPK